MNVSYEAGCVPEALGKAGCLGRLALCSGFVCLPKVPDLLRGVFLNVTINVFSLPNVAVSAQNIVAGGSSSYFTNLIAVFNLSATLSQLIICSIVSTKSALLFLYLR